MGLPFPYPFPGGGQGGTPPTFPTGGSSGFNWQSLIPLLLGGLGTAAGVLNRQQESPFNALLMQLLAPGPGKGNKLFCAQLPGIAKIGEGARTRTTKTFASRGLGQSGLLGESLAGIDTQLIPELQFQARQSATQQAYNKWRDKLSLLSGIPGVGQQGQSGLAAGLQGLAPILMMLFMSGAFGKKS